MFEDISVDLSVLESKGESSKGHEKREKKEKKESSKKHHHAAQDAAKDAVVEFHTHHHHGDIQGDQGRVITYILYARTYIYTYILIYNQSHIQL